jgi:hypothetical protein
MITNRPIHCYCLQPNPPRAQRILWKFEFKDRPPLNFAFVNGNHYVALLPKTDELKRDARYTYCCHFLRDEDIDAFEGRTEENIPTNEVPSIFGGRLNIVSR